MSNKIKTIESLKAAIRAFEEEKMEHKRTVHTDRHGNQHVEDNTAEQFNRIIDIVIGNLSAKIEELESGDT